MRDYSACMSSQTAADFPYTTCMHWIHRSIHERVRADDHIRIALSNFLKSPTQAILCFLIPFITPKGVKIICSTECAE